MSELNLQSGGKTETEYLKKKTEEIELSQKELNENQRRINDKIEAMDRDKISLITIFGIFVSIFTFISVEVKILQVTCDFYKITGLSLIIPGILLVFVFFLDYMARSWIGRDFSKNNKWWVVIIIAIVLIYTGLILINGSSPWKC